MLHQRSFICCTFVWRSWSVAIRAVITVARIQPSELSCGSDIICRPVTFPNSQVVSHQRTIREFAHKIARRLGDVYCLPRTATDAGRVTHSHRHVRVRRSQPVAAVRTDSDHSRQSVR